MARKRSIERGDILDLDAYAAVRKARRAEMIAHKKDRRMAVGPNLTMHFESFDTMLYQVQEMLHTERGGDEQVDDELRAYQPLIPQGNEIVCTFMLEFEDPAIRARELAGLGGIEETVTLEFADHIVRADWEVDVERTTPEGKTSSIHFLHFRLTEAQAEAFRVQGRRVVVAVGHPGYGHMAVMPEATRAALAEDL